MKQFKIVPQILQFDTCKEFCTLFNIGKGDLILTNETYYNAYFASRIHEAAVIFLKNYGKGEPTDEMVEKIYLDIKDLPYDRLIAIGGGTIIDIAKILVQETVSPVLDLYDKRIPTKKSRELVIVPTTCGTGSEVTNVAVLELVSRHTKLGLATDEEYADYAVLIPELLTNLPFTFFATSSIDALIHASESFLSPKASAFSALYSVQAINMILEGYQMIARNGEEARIPLLERFLLASTYAGIAFGNAGCAAVHAMSMPLGGAHHVAHGESNYALFTGIFKTYERLKPDGKIREFNVLLANILGCPAGEAYEKLEDLLNSILPKHPLSYYGVTPDELKIYTETVMTRQGRLMANNYTELDAQTVYGIYQSLL